MVKATRTGLEPGMVMAIEPEIGTENESVIVAGMRTEMEIEMREGNGNMIEH